jgi:hypothetical protein
MEVAARVAPEPLVVLADLPLFVFIRTLRTGAIAMSIDRPPKCVEILIRLGSDYSKKLRQLERFNHKGRVGLSEAEAMALAAKSALPYLPPDNKAESNRRDLRRYRSPTI